MGLMGVEGDPVIGFQEEDEVGRRVVPGTGRCGLEGIAGAIGPASRGALPGQVAMVCLSDAPVAGVDEVEVGFAVGTIQADDQVEGMVGVHDIFGLG